MSRRHWIALCFGCVSVGFLPSCTKSSPPSVTTTVVVAAPAVSAFRCALDNRPGMLVIDLGEGVHVAWDTREGILYKIWRGDVHLTGTVYDTRHGPRPAARGTVLLAAQPTTRESESLSTRPAIPADLLALAQAGPKSRQWLGHRVERSNVILFLRVDGREQRLVFRRAPDAARFPVSFSAR